MPLVSRAEIETVLDHWVLQRDGSILVNTFHNGHWKYLKTFQRQILGYLGLKIKKQNLLITKEWNKYQRDGEKSFCS